MNFDLKELPKKLQPILQKLVRYKVAIVFVSILIIYGWLVYQINSFSSREATDDEVSQQLQTVPRPKIDESALIKIQQLQDNSADVRALFKQARDNPFRE